LDCKEERVDNRFIKALYKTFGGWKVKGHLAYFGFYEEPGARLRLCFKALYERTFPTT